MEKTKGCIFIGVVIAGKRQNFSNNIITEEILIEIICERCRGNFLDNEKNAIFGAEMNVLHTFSNKHMEKQSERERE